MDLGKSRQTQQEYVRSIHESPRIFFDLQGHSKSFFSSRVGRRIARLSVLQPSAQRPLSTTYATVPYGVLATTG